MKRGKAFRSRIIFFALLAVFVFTSNSYGSIHERDFLGFISGSMLLYPVTDNIDLSGKDQLEFKWRRNNLVNTDYYDFRLYKGYNTTTKNLILKERLAVNAYPIKVPASQFEAGSVYTWVLVQVFLDGQKSDKSFASFKVTAK